MPVTGLFLIPVPPNGLSPSTVLISHVSRKFPAQPLPPYFLDHRLLSDTASLLPGSDPARRRHTQFLTLSHLPGKTYLGTSTAREHGAATTDAGAMSLISIPTGPVAEDCFETVMRKMQPLWALRQSVRIDAGTALEMNMGDWRMRIGDVRITSRQGQGNVRGVVVEVEYCGGQDDAEDDGEGGDLDVQEQMLQAFFEGATRDSGVSMDGLRVVVKVPGIKKTEPASMGLGEAVYGASALFETDLDWVRFE